MPSPRSALALFLLGAPFVSGAGSSSSFRAAIERLLAKTAANSAPGCAAGVLLQNRIIFEGAAGTADDRLPLTSSTPFYIASLAKQFTAAAVYLLAAQGKIRLDESIRTSFPELPAYANAITIRQLLNHTSGLRDYSALQEVAGRRDRLDNLGVLRLLAVQRELNFEPGSDYEYSNSDYVLLGLLIEKVAGVSMAEFTRRELFGPLGMERSWFQSGAAPKLEPARGYEMRDGSLHPADPPSETVGDGGMYSSISDLLRWMQNLEHPAGIAKPVIAGIESRARLSSGEVLPHASGLFWNRYHGRATLSHNGVAPGFEADAVYFPQERLSVVCLCNRDDANAAALSRAIADFFLPRNAPARKTATRRIAQDWAGKWESSQGFLLSTVLESANRLRVSLRGEQYSMQVGTRSNEYSADSEGFRLILRRPIPDLLQIGWEGDRFTSFRRLRSVAPSSSELGRYAGRFFNEDLKLAWDLVAAEGALLITNDAGWRIPLEAAAQDRFEVGPWVLEFLRDGGAISGFKLHRARLWARVRKAVTGSAYNAPGSYEARNAVLGSLTFSESQII